MFWCDKENNHIISSKTAHFVAKKSNLVFFSDLVHILLNLVIFAKKPVAALLGYCFVPSCAYLAHSY